MHLLATSARSKEIRHEGKVLSGPQFDQMLKVAAERGAALLLRESPALAPSEIKDRLGFCGLRCRGTPASFVTAGLASRIGAIKQQIQLTR